MTYPSEIAAAEILAPLKRAGAALGTARKAVLDTAADPSAFLSPAHVRELSVHLLGMRAVIIALEGCLALLERQPPAGRI